MKSSETIRDARTSYEKSVLSESDASADPFAQFRTWLDAAVADKERTIEPNAMTVATVGANGAPSARVVLLRGFDERGFVFFTNYESRKGHELATNAHAAIVFWWGALERSIRIEGRVTKIGEAESDDYFARRPRGHRVGAWASEQSRPIANRAVVDDAMRAVEERFGDAEVTRPPFWGGYRLEPSAFEFWQGRKNRVHDRLAYTRDDAGRWTIERLSP